MDPSQLAETNRCGLTCVLPLPVIKNGKIVDPRDKELTKVLQLDRDGRGDCLL